MDSNGAGLNGFLLIDKPSGITSHTVVAMARRSLGTKKIGHAGTLDPMATGLLILGVGPSTRLLTFLVGLDKQYLATIRLGVRTPSDDADSEPVKIATREEIAGTSSKRILEEVSSLTGEIDQVPSSVSAIKVNGKRAYALARAGEQLDLPARKVRVSSFEVLAERREEFIDLDVKVDCSSGTYIRALARDLGEALGIGGHLISLRRTIVGPFVVEDAVKPTGDDFASELVQPAELLSKVLSTVTLDANQSEALRLGKRVKLSGSHQGPVEDSTVATIDSSGRLIGVAEIKSAELRAIMNLSGGNSNG